MQDELCEFNPENEVYLRNLHPERSREPFPNLEPDIFPFIPSIDDLKTALHNTCNGKASGPFGWRGEFYQPFVDETPLMKSLLRLINAALSGTLSESIVFFFSALTSQD